MITYHLQTIIFRRTWGATSINHRTEFLKTLRLLTDWNRAVMKLGNPVRSDMLSKVHIGKPQVTISNQQGRVITLHKNHHSFRRSMCKLNHLPLGSRKTWIHSCSMIPRLNLKKTHSFRVRTGSKHILSDYNQPPPVDLKQTYPTTLPTSGYQHNQYQGKLVTIFKK